MNSTEQSTEQTYPFRTSPDEAAAIEPDNQYDWYIFTDGSGYIDHLGGFAAIAYNKKLHKKLVSYGCSTHTETGRAEFTAILNGFHSILDVIPDYKREYGEGIVIKPSALIVTDREDLAGSISGVFGRNANLDLWARFDYYAKLFHIHIKHVHRETNKHQHLADVIASNMRVVLDEFKATQTDVGNI